MHWDDLRYLAAFAEYGSLLGAARALGTEHATVGRRIEQLETALGLKLLDRRGRRLSLTLAGERILVIAQNMQAEAHAALRIAEGSRDDLTGEVTITAPPAFAAHVIAPRLAGFADAYPNLLVRLLGEARQASLNRREADIAVRLSRPTEDDLVQLKLMEIGFRPYATADYLEQHVREHWRFIGSDGDIRHSPQQQALQDIAGKNRFAYRSGDVMIQASLAAEGAGIAMLPDFLAGRQSGLIPALPDHPPLMRSVWLVLHNDLRQAPKVRAVVDYLCSIDKGDRGTERPIEI